MKPRARRIAILTVAAGCLVVAGLVALNWQTVRDHAEAWWFQVTTETRTFDIRATGRITIRLESTAIIELLAKLAQKHSATVSDVVACLESHSYRIIDQRFPRADYVVVGYPGP